MRQFFKDPDDVIDYSVDWTAWLDGETISSSSFDVATGLTKDTEGNSTTVATVRVSGGTDATPYKVTNQITTSTGQLKSRSFEVVVRESDT